MEEGRNAFKMVTGKHMEKKPLGMSSLGRRTILW